MTLYIKYIENFEKLSYLIYWTLWSYFIFPLTHRSVQVNHDCVFIMIHVHVCLIESSEDKRAHSDSHFGKRYYIDIPLIQDNIKGRSYCLILRSIFMYYFKQCMCHVLFTIAGSTERPRIQPQMQDFLVSISDTGKCKIKKCGEVQSNYQSRRKPKLPHWHWGHPAAHCGLYGTKQRFDCYTFWIAGILKT